ncbi:WD40 repeat domain-containing protein [Marilutibacter alkalisoli]|uniref:WD40 repeat domain-containing protein n=1 Tax=Marilutibacter alkalisoli TaxID=2591633 RepID=A0A514BMU7_9GAMM|nr:hypothetical protein [Lysobacter alkalisoli]QDH68713.1 hypothetical protein FKV23_00220 [Lysobacter alkalisoli]
MTEPNSPDAASPDTVFDSIEAASERWIDEGRAYKKALNDWLDGIYIDRQSPATPEPAESRQDMAGYVLEQIRALNHRGEHARLRELFPPDNDPMDWDGKVWAVSQAAFLPDGRIACTIGMPHEPRRVHVLEGNDASVLEGAILFGRSHDKRYFAFAHVDRIEVRHGWDGEVVATLPYPDSYGNAFAQAHPDVRDGLRELDGAGWRIHQLVVFPDGRRVAMASAAGIFVVGEQGAQLLVPEADAYARQLDDDDPDGKDGFVMSLSYPHVDVSADGRYIATGEQDSSHLIFHEVDGAWTQMAAVEPRASYPCLARFNHLLTDADGVPQPEVALASCHFSRSATLSLPLANLSPGFEASGYEADDTLNYVDDRHWASSLLPSKVGYFIGAQNGYIWMKSHQGYQFGYLHVGGSVLDLDLSEDRKTLLVASYSGQLVQFRAPDEEVPMFITEKNVERPDPYLITNSRLKDVKRHLFLIDEAPMVW